MSYGKYSVFDLKFMEKMIYMVTLVKEKILTFGKMIKFHHTVFALPFALSAVVMAWRNHPFKISDFIWILVAMVGARSAAMGFNRIADAAMDGKNPRTAAREIPTGVLKKKDAVIFVLISSLIFIFSAAMLGKLCFILSFPVLFFLFFYSYTKRFTKFCHIYLGAAISLAPLGAWIAVTGSVSISVIFLTLALMTYIAGFDILYACQDIDFDRKENLYSFPAVTGPEKAMKFSSVLHCFTFIFLFFMYLSFKMHPVFLGFLLLIGMLLIAEHKIVKPDDLQHINVAFFNINSIISILLFAGILTDAIIR